MNNFFFVVTREFFAQDFHSSWVTLNNNFCHEWGDLPMIFTSNDYSIYRIHTFTDQKITSFV